MKRTLIGIMTLMFVFTSTFSFAESDLKDYAMVGDTLVARPVGIASVVLGSALFVVSLPFSALGGNVDEAADRMVSKPFKFTFKRPIGDFRQEQENRY